MKNVVNEFRRAVIDSGSEENMRNFETEAIAKKISLESKVIALE